MGKVYPDFMLRDGNLVTPGRLVSLPYDGKIRFGIAYRTPDKVPGLAVMAVDGDPVEPFLYFLSENDKVLEYTTEWRLSTPAADRPEVIEVWDTKVKAGYIVCAAPANYILLKGVIAGREHLYYLDMNSFILYSQSNRPGEPMRIEFLIKKWRGVVQGDVSGGSPETVVIDFAG